MQYLLMAYVDETGWPKMSKSEQEQGMAAYAAYGEALKTSGVIKGSNRLQPSSVATTVRSTNGKSQVLDGPYVDSKEQLGGYFLIDVPIWMPLFRGLPAARGQSWSGGGAPDLEYAGLTGLSSLGSDP